MGLSISWIAVEAHRKDEAVSVLGLKDTGAECEPWNTGFSWSKLSTGWVLIYSDDTEFAAPDRLKRLSATGRAVSCVVEEHVMFSEARGYENGAEQWRVTHDSDKGIYSLEVTGTPPAAFEGIRARLVEQQDSEGGAKADVDFIFDIPLTLGEAICGFRPDEGDYSFTELRSNQPARDPDPKPQRRGFLSRLFGKD